MTTIARAGVLADRYRLVRELGRGGMGSVWLGVDNRLERRVAVKVIDPQRPPTLRGLARFEQEAKAVARLRSPYIVEIYDYGTEPAPFIVMELLEGRELSERLHGGRNIALDIVSRIVAQIAEGLTVAHAAGVIHRDLKPGNIFLVRRQSAESVKVFDFGLAKVLEGRSRALTGEGAFLGTPIYMSPEQLRGETDLDARADVWSLGVLAYRMLTGRHPFESGTVTEAIESILTDPPHPAAASAEWLPAELDAFFERALAKRREERFQSAADLSEALCDVADVSASFGISKGPPSSPDSSDETTRALPERSPCIDDNVFAAYLDRITDERDKRRMHAHMDVCSGCREVFVALASQALFERIPGDERSPEDASSDEETHTVPLVVPSRPTLALDDGVTVPIPLEARESERKSLAAAWLTLVVIVVLTAVVIAYLVWAGV